MREVAYRRWLEGQKYGAGTITSQMHRAGRVEKYHGDLDEHYLADRMAGLIAILRYSKDDERHNRPNPSKIPFDGNCFNNLASYRDSVVRYGKFRDASDDAGGTPTRQDPRVLGATSDEEIAQRIGLERDMQAALRVTIEQLESGLTIIDEGAERSVESGFIDITARDASGAVVVIELKAGAAGQRAVAQILSYIGDVAVEQEDGRVRGILVASEFDAKAKAAARVVPTLMLRKYSVRFTFSDGHG